MTPRIEMQNINLNNSVDAEIARSKPPKGYPRIASLMAEYPEVAMVRRFRGLNARHLLYLQSELAEIEVKLLKLEKDNAKEELPSNKGRYATDYYWLKDSARNQGDNEQWQLVQDMKKKLREYSMPIQQIP